MDACGAGSECLSSSSLHLVKMVVFVEARPRDEITLGFTDEDTVHADPDMVDVEDRFADAVTRDIKRRLGTQGDTIPTADSAITWQSLGARILVVVHRSGRVTVAPASVPMTRADSVGIRMLADAANTAEAGSSEPRLPESVGVDSAVFEIAFISPTVDSAGKKYELPVRRAFPAFAIREPWFNRAEVVHLGPLSPDDRARMAGYGVRLTTSVLVNTTGHMVEGSLVLRAPPQKLSNAQQTVYDAFARSVKATIEGGIFRPASVSGCKVGARTSISFNFSPDSRTH